jgi:hypothetical protein
MRILALLNLAYPPVVVVVLVALAASGGEAWLEPARLSDAGVFAGGADVFRQFTYAVVPVAVLIAAHLSAYRAARSRDEWSRRRARAWCLAVIVLVASFGVQAAALGAFETLSGAQVAACIGGLAAMVAVCALNILSFRRPWTAADRDFLAVRSL